MSLDTLATEVAAKPGAPTGLASPKSGAATPSPAPGAPQGDAALQPGSGAEPHQNALNLVSKYLPTESITLYVAGATVMPDEYKTAFLMTMWFITPLILYLVTVFKLRTVNPNASRPLFDCELILKLTFSFIAFWIWAHALPDPNGDAKIIALYGFLALAASTLFSLVE